MAGTAQLNIRLDSDLKAAGDSVLGLCGVSPTELVRALWAKVAHGEEALDQVVRALAADPAADSPRTQGRSDGKTGIAAFVQRRQNEFEQQTGLDPSTYVTLDDEHLNELVYNDWLEEKRGRDAV